MKKYFAKLTLEVWDLISLHPLAPEQSSLIQWRLVHYFFHTFVFYFSNSLGQFTLLKMCCSWFSWLVDILEHKRRNFTIVTVLNNSSLGTVQQQTVKLCHDKSVNVDLTIPVSRSFPRQTSFCFCSVIFFPMKEVPLRTVLSVD